MKYRWRYLNTSKPNSPALFIPLISSLSNRYRGAAQKDCAWARRYSGQFFLFFFHSSLLRTRLSMDRHRTKSIRITIRIDKRDARVTSVYFFLLFFYFFHGVHGRTSSEQMAAYNSRAKLASEYFATNADFANHLSIQPLGLPWSWPEGTL